jgi:hypothetical protein
MMKTQHGISVVMTLGLVWIVATASTPAPPTSVTVSVPGYDVTEVGGVAEATIPGGRVLASEEGRPLVPYWVERIPLSEYDRVQEVTLRERGEAVEDSGLVLLSVQPDLGPAVPPKPGWFPARPFSWKATYGAEPELAIAVYPFRYEPETGRSEFTKRFEFDIRWVRTTVSIDDVRLEEAVVDPGGVVVVWVEIANSGSAFEVEVSGLIRRMWSEDTAGLLEPVLLTARGEDSIRLAWPSGRADVGEYEFAVLVRDKSGDLLDRSKTLFRLGIPHGEATGFEVEPEHFELGDQVELSLTFENTGTCDVEGECVFRISQAGELVDELRQPMGRTKPGATRTFKQVWDTKDATAGVVYHAAGFVRFAGTATKSRSAMFSTNHMPERLVRARHFFGR